MDFSIGRMQGRPENCRKADKDREVIAEAGGAESQAGGQGFCAAAAVARAGGHCGVRRVCEVFDPLARRRAGRTARLDRVQLTLTPEVRVCA